MASQETVRQETGGGSDPSIQEEGSPGEEKADSSPISQDTIFEILSNQRRRFVLHYLKHHEEPTPLSDLVETVAAWENGVEPEDLSYKERKRTYTSLYQSHLPKMADAGVIECNHSRDDIQRTDRADALDDYLERTPEPTTAWHRYYLGLAAGGATLFAAQVVGTYPLSLLPASAVYGTVVATFLVSSLVHTYRVRDSGAESGPKPPEILDS